MKTYLIECMETNTFVVEVEAQSEDEARELAHEDNQKHGDTSSKVRL